MAGKKAALIAMALTMLASSVASAQAPLPPAPPPPDWSLVEFEVKSWGRQLHRWTIMTNGGGSWIEPADENQAGKTRWFAVAPDVSHYVALETVLRRLPAVAPDFNRCESFMADQPYGTIRLTKAATTTEIAWNAGCMDPAYLPFINTLKQADEMVKGWRTQPGEVVDTPQK